MEWIKRTFIIISLVLFVSCIRTYKVTFNYIADGRTVATEELTEDSNGKALPAPINFIIYVQAEVPKNIDANADATLPLPLP